MVKVLSSTLPQLLGPFTILLFKGSSEMLRFRHLPHHLFESMQFWKYMGYEGQFFFSKCSKFNVDFKNAERNGEKVCCF